MKAVHATQFGDPSVLKLTELPDPQPGVDEITIDVSHSAVGLIDVLLRKGFFKDVPGLPQPPFVPGLEVAGIVRAVGAEVSDFVVGQRVVAMSAGSGTGGYASIFVAKAHLTISIDNPQIDPALAVATIPNAAMAFMALTKVANLVKGESVLIHGALGGFASSFAGMAKMLGAGQVVGTVRAGKMDLVSNTKLPFDLIVDSADITQALNGQFFDIIIDAVGGEIRSQSINLMKPGSRMIVSGNASGDWQNQIGSNDIWLRGITIAGFNASAFIPFNLSLVLPALQAAREVLLTGLCDIEVEVLPFESASEAHERMESRDLKGRIVLTP